MIFKSEKNLCLSSDKILTVLMMLLRYIILCGYAFLFFYFQAKRARGCDIMTRSANTISTISKFSDEKELSENSVADPGCEGNDNLAFEENKLDENGRINGNVIKNTDFELPTKKAPSAALNKFRSAARTVGVSVKVVGVWNDFAKQTTIHGVRMITEKSIYKLRR